MKNTIKNLLKIKKETQSHVKVIREDGKQAYINGVFFDVNEANRNADAIAEKYLWGEFKGCLNPDKAKVIVDTAYHYYIGNVRLLPLYHTVTDTKTIRERVMDWWK